uniref:Uncharacterized protein n=1 Tax=Panagrolaimus davidi TaxID=227884 RepID=A0A914QR77_9BILA
MLDRAWIWQTCNEFGNYQTTDSPITSNNFIGNVLPVNYYVKICSEIFDSSLSNFTVYKNVQNTNNLYHGQYGYNGTKVVFPNGSNDPWHVLGVLSPTNDKTYPIIIDGASHCDDMIPNPATDTPALIEARQKIRSHVLSWVYE